MQNKYSIRNIEELTGIKAATIRMWEKRYGIVSPQRSAGQVRYYGEKDLRKLLLISYLQKRGYKISEISKMTDEELVNRTLTISSSEKILQGSIEMVNSAILNFNAPFIEKILNDLFISEGFKNTFNYLILPVFQSIEYLSDNKIFTKAHKNFAFYIFEKVLIRAVNNIEWKNKEKKYLLFTDVGKTNFLILLYATYILRNKNNDVVFLGAFDNISDFLQSIENNNAINNRIVTTSMTFKKDNDILQQTVKNNYEISFFILDPLAVLDDDSELLNLFLINDLNDFESEIV